MKVFRNIIKIIFIVMLFIVVPFFSLNYILVNDVKSYTRIMLHELYYQEDNIDVLFLGPSHCYRSLVPEITDEMWNKNTFNAGTSSQSMDGAYALLNEVVKDNELETVYLEMAYVTMGEKYAERTLLTSTYIISDYMRPSVNKYSYMLQAIPKEFYIEGFFPARRNWRRLFEPNYVNNILNGKKSEEYQEYAYVDNGNESYLGKGYVGNWNAIGEGEFLAEGNFNPIRDNRLSEDDICYVKRIKELCDKKGIELVLFSAPMSDFRLCGVGNYDNYVGQVEQLASEIGVEYYDFNLCKEEVLNMEETDFYDDQHLNNAGAEKFSKYFAEFVSNGKKMDGFYQSYEEKMDQIDKALGMVVNKTESTLSFQAIATREMKLSYTLDMIGDDGANVSVAGIGMMAELPLDEMNGNTEVTITFYDETGAQVLKTKYSYEADDKITL